MPAISSMLFLRNFSTEETDDQSFAGLLFLSLKETFHQLNLPLLRKKKNAGELINLLHQAAGSDFFTI